ncbi:acetolactate synthase small subunit [Salinarimonas sp. NSM]|uniref:acetolactate synthase small subunit n=1 Tax=Salinarimonas sp. NSM TaxID=3458003 RepID=UPI00403692AC
MNQTHYPAAPVVEAVNRHTLAVIVDNEPGVLARIAGLFSGRGYNIESLTVSETHHETHVSRITIVTAGTAGVIEQIKAHLERLVPVHRVDDLTVRGEALERELCLVKVAGEGDHRVEALRLASAFGARTLDATLTSFVFELTGASEDIERFVKLMAGVGLVEVARTGVAAMSRGAEAMEG